MLADEDVELTQGAQPAGRVAPDEERFVVRGRVAVGGVPSRRTAKAQRASLCAVATTARS